MNPSELRATVTELRQQAYFLRFDRNNLQRANPTIPKDITKHLTDAAQSIDDAAAALLAEYGEPMPDGVL